MAGHKTIRIAAQADAAVQASSEMFPKGIRLTVHLPENIPETVRQQKINRIYDILTPENF